MPVQVRRGAPFARKVFAAAFLTASQRDRVRLPVRALDTNTVPLSERLGPCLPSKRAGFDSRAVLETACLGPAVPHGVARAGTSALSLRRRQVERAQPSEGSVCWFESSRRYATIWPRTHLVRRTGCRPVEEGSIPFGAAAP